MHIKPHNVQLGIKDMDRLENTVQRINPGNTKLF